MNNNYLARPHKVAAFLHTTFVILLSLGERYPRQAGIILAYQKSMNLNELINALDRVLWETDADEWIGQTRWLNDRRK
jgi:hypothetical protein